VPDQFINLTPLISFRLAKEMLGQIVLLRLPRG